MYKLQIGYIIKTSRILILLYAQAFFLEKGENILDYTYVQEAIFQVYFVSYLHESLPHSSQIKFFSYESLISQEIISQNAKKCAVIISLYGQTRDDIAVTACMHVTPGRCFL